MIYYKFLCIVCACWPHANATSTKQFSNVVLLFSPRKSYLSSLRSFVEKSEKFEFYFHTDFFGSFYLATSSNETEKKTNLPENRNEQVHTKVSHSIENENN